MLTRNTDQARTGLVRPLELSVGDGGQAAAVVHVAGEIDADAAVQLEAQLRDQLNPASRLRRLVVDLSAVESMVPDGLNVLLAVEKCCFARSVRLCLVDCSPPVLQLLETAGLGDHFRQYSMVAEAKA